MHTPTHATNRMRARARAHTHTHTHTHTAAAAAARGGGGDGPRARLRRRLPRPRPPALVAPRRPRRPGPERGSAGGPGAARMAGPGRGGAGRWVCVWYSRLEQCSPEAETPVWRAARAVHGRPSKAAITRPRSAAAARPGDIPIPGASPGPGPNWRDSDGRQAPVPARPRHPWRAGPPRPFRGRWDRFRGPESLSPVRLRRVTTGPTQIPERILFISSQTNNSDLHLNLAHSLGLGSLSAGFHHRAGWSDSGHFHRG